MTSQLPRLQNLAAKQNGLSTPKPSSMVWALLFAAAILLGAASCSTVPAGIESNYKSIRVVMDNNYPPYAFQDESGQMQGILIDQWRAWEEESGVGVEIIGLPWDQALAGMREEKYDVIDTIFLTEERLKVFDFTDPYAQINVNIFFPENLSGLADAASLRGFHVAVKTGDANVDYLISQGVTDLVYYDSYESIIQAVSRQDEAVFVIDEPPALYFLQKYDIRSAYNFSPPLYSGAFHRAVKKGDTELLGLINAGFASISRSTYQQINDRWLGRSYNQDVGRIFTYFGISAAATLGIIAALMAFNRSLQIRVAQRTSELQEALTNLRASEMRFRDAIDFMPIPISIADEAGHILTVNKQFTDTFGYTHEDIPTVNQWMEHAYPDVHIREAILDQWGSDVSAALQNKATTPLREYEVTGKDGKLHNTEILMHPIHNIWVASFVEITEHKQNVKAIRESEERFRTLFEDSPIPLLEEDFTEAKTYLDQLKAGGVTDLAAYFKEHPQELNKLPEMIRVVEVNAASVKWYGHQNKQALKVRLSELVHPREYSRILDEILIFEKGVDHYEVSVEGRARDGSPLYLIINGSLAPGYEQTWGRVIVSILDITESKSAEQNLKEAYDTTLEGWARALELRDKETEGHSRRVIDITLMIARQIGIPESELLDVRRGAILHDIGKMTIPDDVLKKPGPLTAAEREVIQKHPQAAYDLLCKIPYLQKAIDIPYCHHEKWDGSGYPRGLKGEEIPIHARIFAVVDVWDALTNDRPYRNAWEKEAATQYLKQESGKHFDPAIVEVFLGLLEQGKI